MNVILRRMLLLSALFVALVGIRHASADDASGRLKPGEAFSDMCYRRSPVVRHIARTKAWQDGRRDILDWGCGGGGLSLALAEQGATTVTAIDLHDKAIQVANQRLRKFPHATARRPQLGSKITGNPGQIAYSNQFDVVVSFMGALTDGTAGALKITSKTAMESAVRACRDEGYVIVAECYTVRFFAAMLILLLSIAAHNLVGNLHWWQTDPLLLTLSYLGCGSDVGIWVMLAARAIALDLEMTKLGIITIVGLPSFFYWLISGLKDHWERESQLRGEMKSAGLVDIRASRRLCVRVTEVLEATDLAKLNSSILNALCYPGMIVVYQGKKPRTRH